MNRLLVVAVGVAFLIGSASAATATPSSDIRACVNLNGVWTTPSGPCANDHWVTWNSQGPAGPAGAPGQDGAQGPAGSLDSAASSRILAKIAKGQALEAKIAKAKPGSVAERNAVIALSKIYRAALTDAVQSLSAG